MKSAITMICAVILAAGSVCAAKPILDNYVIAEAEKAGKCNGSEDGKALGLIEGAEAGKMAGLSAEDTTADIYSSIYEVGKLEVLKASASINNFHEIGTDYAKLQIYSADVVFTVDLKKAAIDESDETIRIILPAPECSIAVDEEKTEIVEEYQKYFFSGSAEDGYYAEHNVRRELDEKGAEALENYSALREAAENSAVKNVRILAEKVNAGCKNIEVVFDEEMNDI